MCVPQLVHLNLMTTLRFLRQTIVPLSQNLFAHEHRISPMLIISLLLSRPLPPPRNPASLRFAISPWSFSSLAISSDVINMQPNRSLDYMSHMKDSRPAREEIERIVKGLTRFDQGLTVRFGYGCRVCLLPPFARACAAELLAAREDWYCICFFLVMFVHGRPFNV